MIFKVDSDKIGLTSAFWRVSVLVIFLVFDPVGVGANLGVPNAN